MSLLLTKGDRLFGRYWGSRRDVPNLHFNLCYYEPIRWAIANNIRHYDPGIGGAHKPRRGFRAVPTYSLHHFFDPRLRHVWDLSIAGVNTAESEHILQINRRLPLAHRA
jgi:predicted N-acyltransferase